MFPEERKTSAIEVGFALGAGIGFIFELFSSAELRVGTGVISGAGIGIIVGGFISALASLRRKRKS